MLAEVNVELLHVSRPVVADAGEDRLHVAGVVLNHPLECYRLEAVAKCSVLTLSRDNE